MSVMAHNLNMLAGQIRLKTAFEQSRGIAQWQAVNFVSKKKVGPTLSQQGGGNTFSSSTQLTAHTRFLNAPYISGFIGNLEGEARLKRCKDIRKKLDDEFKKIEAERFQQGLQTRMNIQQQAFNVHTQRQAMALQTRTANTVQIACHGDEAVRRQYERQCENINEEIKTVKKELKQARKAEAREIKQAKNFQYKQLTSDDCYALSAAYDNESSGCCCILM